RPPITTRPLDPLATQQTARAVTVDRDERAPSAGPQRPGEFVDAPARVGQSVQRIDTAGGGERRGTERQGGQVALDFESTSTVDDRDRVAGDGQHEPTRGQSG